MSSLIHNSFRYFFPSPPPQYQPSQKGIFDDISEWIIVEQKEIEVESLIHNSQNGKFESDPNFKAMSEYHLPSYEESNALEALFLEKQELVLERKKLIEAVSELEKMKKELEEKIRKEMGEKVKAIEKVFWSEQEKSRNKIRKAEQENKKQKEEYELLRRKIEWENEVKSKYEERKEVEEKKIIEDDIKVSISKFEKVERNAPHGGLTYTYTFNVSWTIPVENFEFTENREDVYIVANNYEGKYSFFIYKVEKGVTSDSDRWWSSPNAHQTNPKYQTNPFVDFLISHPNYLSPFLQQYPQKDLPKLIANKIQKEISNLYLKYTETKMLSNILLKYKI